MRLFAKTFFILFVFTLLNTPVIAEDEQDNKYTGGNTGWYGYEPEPEKKPAPEKKKRPKGTQKPPGPVNIIPIQIPASNK